MKTFAIVLALALVASATAASVPFKTCGSGVITVNTVDVTGTLSPGSTVTVNATGTTSAAITSGTAKLVVKFFGITLYSETSELCSGKYFHVNCPVAVGDFTGSGVINVPSAAPKGSYTVQISATDGSTDLFCVSLSVSISESDRHADPVLDKISAVDATMIDNVNRIGEWEAHASPRFQGRSLQYVKGLCGTHKGFLTKLPLSTLPVADSIPESFDSRSAPQWSACKSRLSHIRDQADCGSCWAFGSTEAFNDRLCIATNGQYQAELSAQDTTSCCNLFTGCGFSQGCQGGDPTAAWSYFVNTGVVTGGDYDTIGTGSSCFPYQLANCAHHEPSPKYPNCSESIAQTPACPNPKACSESKYSTPWANDKQHAKSAYSISGVQNIQTEIMTYGPVTAAFTVYADFPTYKSGVYQHVQGGELGGHAIKIIGWGVEDGKDYWLVANSWNQYWGMDGFFKILRGVDECGIEDDVSAGHA